MKKMRILIALAFALLALAPLVLAVPWTQRACCPEQLFLTLDGLDPNHVATDPVSGRKLVFKRIAGYTGRPVPVDGFALDPDNDDPNASPQVIEVWRTVGGGIQKLTVDPNGAWQFVVTYSTDGWHYETVSASDGMLIRTGTVAIKTTTNRPPSLCGGQPW